MNSALRPIALASAVMAFSIAPAKADLVVLQYHHIDDSTPPSTSTSRSLFQEQLAMVQELALEVVPLLPGTRAALAGETADSSQIAITFDDAYESVYDTAAPLLAELNMPYTIFVNTNAVGGRGYMTWDELAELAQDDRVTLANHSADHGHLARKPEESQEDWNQRVTASLDEAQQALEQRLDQNVPMFAYPYGEYDEALEAKLAERGWLGFGQQSGAIGQYSHDTRLPRFPMANTYGQLNGLKDKLRSKAFPTPAEALPDGVFEQNPPTLTFAVGDEIDPGRLTCFASGVGRVDFEVTGDQISVTAPSANNSRRFRYNCTHPAGDGSFYWLSQQWLNLEAPED
ncbi:MAG: polysaccharide deacetylase family protein [Pseudomonadota bacterium]|nr:polysaccharide deacetylase family protein [Pseudomonadota bacterium]